MNSFAGKLTVILLPVLAYTVANIFANIFQALTAYLLGDDSAKISGFFNINPLNHLNVEGFVSSVLILMLVSLVAPKALFHQWVIVAFIMVRLFNPEWFKIVPFNPMNVKNKRLGMIFFLAARIISGFVLAILNLFFIKIFVWSGMGVFFQKGLITLCMGISYVSIFLSILSMLPLPNLEGIYILELIYPALAEKIEEIINPFLYLLIIFFILYTEMLSTVANMVLLLFCKVIL